MNTKQPANMPRALSEARRQLDHWRSQRPGKRTRLPKEFWQRAVTLAKEHGLKKTARVLNVKYYSLKKPLDQANLDKQPGAPLDNNVCERDSRKRFFIGKIHTSIRPKTAFALETCL
jgi:hypothetical protein